MRGRDSRLKATRDHGKGTADGKPTTLSCESVCVTVDVSAEGRDWPREARGTPRMLGLTGQGLSCDTCPLAEMSTVTDVINYKAAPGSSP